MARAAVLAALTFITADAAVHGKGAGGFCGTADNGETHHCKVGLHCDSSKHCRDPSSSGTLRGPVVSNDQQFVGGVQISHDQQIVGSSIQGSGIQIEREQSSGPEISARSVPPGGTSADPVITDASTGVVIGGPEVPAASFDGSQIHMGANGVAYIARDLVPGDSAVGGYQAQADALDDEHQLNLNAVCDPAHPDEGYKKGSLCGFGLVCVKQVGSDDVATCMPPLREDGQRCGKELHPPFHFVGRCQMGSECRAQVHEHGPFKGRPKIGAPSICSGAVAAGLGPLALVIIMLAAMAAR